MVTQKDRARFIRENNIESNSTPGLNGKLLLAIRDREGMILDFGVYKARSTNFFASHFPWRTVYGFDSFEGLPEKYTDRLVKGSFALKELPKVSKNVELVVGYFEATVEPFLKSHKDEEVSFINFDCDLKSSTLTVLRALYKYGKLTSGVVLRFDEFFNEEDGSFYATEYEALMEFQEETGIEISWIGASNNWKVFVGVIK